MDGLALSTCFEGGWLFGRGWVVAAKRLASRTLLFILIIKPLAIELYFAFVTHHMSLQ